MLNFLECRDLVVKILNFLEGQLFANLCTALSAIGTIGAVIVALFFSYRENRVRYKITSSIVAIVNPTTKERIATGYGIEIVNLSFNKNIMLRQSIYVKLTKKENITVFVNKNLPKEYITPKVLMPGESFTFLIEEKQIKAILDKVNSKKITIYFSDKSNMKYKIKVKRKNLENFSNPSKEKNLNKCTRNYMLDFFKNNIFTIICVILGISIIIGVVIMFDVIKDNVFFTFISSVLVFIFSQFILEMIINPMTKFKEIKSKIIYYLKLYENLILYPYENSINQEKENYINASMEIRKLAAEFAGHIDSHPLVCNKNKYKDIVVLLIGISNRFFKINSTTTTVTESIDRLNEIYNKFKIKDEKFKIRIEENMFKEK